MKFEQALQYLRQLEGGYVSDAGGPTDFGITQKAWSSFCDRLRMLRCPVSSISWVHVRQFYMVGYWEPLKCASLPDGVDFVLFQWAVNHEGYGNHGPAIEDLQLCCGAHPDGILGPLTVEAANGVDRLKLIRCLLNRQKQWYEDDARKNPTEPIKGWENRVRMTAQFVGVA